MQKFKIDGSVIFIVVILGLLLVGVIVNFWDEHDFNKMTPAQHLNEAKNTVLMNHEDVKTAMRHIEAIPENSPQFAEAEHVKANIYTKQSEWDEASTAKEKAKIALNSAAVQLETDLKNLGYDMSVEVSQTSNELVITSSEFDDSDHRIRFLSFIRGRNAPTFGVCLAGFNKVRLMTYQYSPWRFNESHSLDCR